MKQRQHLKTDISRRNWLVLTASATASALTACGGGGSTMASAPGTGGTGIYAQGSISGFGSVIMNGVKFDDTKASVLIDGLSALSSDLRLGMVAGISGERGSDLTLGTASSIEVWSIAQGLVTEVSITAIGEFKVSGMTLQTDSNTTFDGITDASALTTGLVVAVWGLQVNADGNIWKATRVKALSTAETTVVSTGLINISVSDGHTLRTVNEITLLSWPATAVTLVDHQLVRIQGTMTGNSMTVSSVKLLSVNNNIPTQTEVEIEGFVTSTPSAGGFMLGTIQVDTSKASYKPADAQPLVILDARVEVYGTWQAGVLVASIVEVEDAVTLKTVEITGAVDEFVSVANFKVRGQRCNATNATLLRGVATDLKQGSLVKVKGTKSGGDMLTVTELTLYV
ncbi:MAG: DUF5666 domain-containing protein [Rhodoferax sp.]